jgi:uncharacterized membrane protein
VFDRLFEIAFKYRPLIFQQGALAFNPPWPEAAVIAIVLAAGAVAAWSYARSAPRVPRLVRALLLGLRLAVLGLLLFALSRPVLVIRAVEPQQNFLAVLVDDSRSMAIADEGPAPRGAFVAEALGPGQALREALGRRFALRFFRFASSTERMAEPQAATFTGTRSDITQALQRVPEELAGLPVSGIVMVTDGADSVRQPMAEALRALKAAGLPVFTVGVGRESFERDVQLGRVDPPSSVLKSTTLVVDVVVGQTGYAGRTVPLIVEDEGQMIASQEITLPADGEPAAVRVRFTLAEAGPRVLQFRIPVQDGEQVSQNNARQALVTVEDRRERILYIEGEPRFEMKFLRQAVADDKNLQVVTLQRTADRKFLRLDIDTAEELAGGFPKTREELFAYRGIILGSIEASAFTPDQLRMMADFVSVRGGGLLALGGRRSFAEGGYAGTPVGEALPVLLGTAKAPEAFLEKIQVMPTRLGQTHVATQIAATEQESAARWAKLPSLTAVNPIRQVKPGAAVLLSGAGPSRDAQVVLAFQRYGAGRTLAMPVQDVWQWQMHASIPVEDQTHETLCRRLLRWLVDGVPARLSVSVERERVEPGDSVSVVASVRDEGFVSVNDAAVRARVTGPRGAEIDLPMALVVDRDGEYRASFVAQEAGLYEIRADAARGTDKAETARAFVRAAPDDGEFFDAAMRAPLLARIADETGGRFYTKNSVRTLPDDITYLGRGVTTAQEKDLWDMPAVFALVVGLAAAEWFLRRRRGLA